MQFELFKSGGLWYWRLRADKHQIIAHGAGYVEKEDAKYMVVLVMETSPKTPLIELDH